MVVPRYSLYKLMECSCSVHNKVTFMVKSGACVCELGYSGLRRSCITEAKAEVSGHVIWPRMCICDARDFGM